MYFKFGSGFGLLACIMTVCKSQSQFRCANGRLLWCDSFNSKVNLQHGLIGTLPQKCLFLCTCCKAHLGNQFAYRYLQRDLWMQTEDFLWVRYADSRNLCHIKDVQETCIKTRTYSLVFFFFELKVLHFGISLGN